MSRPFNLRSAAAAGAAALTAALLIATPAGAAGASTDTTSLSLTGSTLDFVTAPAVGNLPNTTINGAGQTVNASAANWSVNDKRGTGAGWNVIVQASQMSDVGATHVLPASSMQLTKPSAVTRNSILNLSTAPTIASGTAFTIDGGSSVQLTTSPALTALGQWDFTQANAGVGDLALSIAPNAYAADYSSTLTYTLGLTP